MVYYEKLFYTEISDKKIYELKLKLEKDQMIDKYKVIIYYKDSKNLIEAVNTKYIYEILGNKKILVLGFSKNSNDFKNISKNMFEYFLDNNVNIIKIKEYLDGKLNDK